MGSVEKKKFLSLSLNAGECSASRPSCFTPARNLSTHRIGDWMCPRADLDVFGQRHTYLLPMPEFEPRIVYPVT